MRRLAATLALCSSLGCKPEVPAPVPLDPPPEQALVCAWTTVSLTIDGVASEPIWSVTRPTLLLPSLGESTGQAHCLRTDDGLAIFVTGPDTHLTASVTEHDGRTWDDDVFEVFVQPDTGEHYFEFHVTPLGTTLDLRLPAPEGSDARTTNAPVFHQLSAVHLDGTLNDNRPDQGWSAEFLIPWSDLGGEPEAGDTWTGHIARYDYAPDGTYALASTAPFTEVGFHRRHEWPVMLF